MLAVHLENLLFLLLLVVAGLFQLLGRAARKGSADEEKPKSTPLPKARKPIPRAPVESDQERIRKFLEALGQPPASRPFFFQAEDGIRARDVTGVQTCALPI